MCSPYKKNNTYEKVLCLVKCIKLLIGFRNSGRKNRSSRSVTAPLELKMRIIDRCLREGVNKGIYSGAQAAWCSERAGVVGEVAVGTTGGPESAEITHRTLFDIASVTKVFTAGAALRLADRGEIELDARLGEFLTEFTHKQFLKATIAQILAHEAGFTAWHPFYEYVGRAAKEPEATRREIIELALKDYGISSPADRATYSDVGYIVLTAVLERVAECDLAELINTEVTGPLGLKSVRFNPISDDPAAATRAAHARGGLLMGNVYDDNARAMCGVAGHAGLFANAIDIARYGAAWLAARRAGGWISAKMANRATTRRPSGRGLGWDFPAENGSQAGEIMSPHTFGHLGFTGCSLWVDPTLELSVALHTNRVIAGEDKAPIREFRAAFHDLVARFVQGVA